MPSVTSKTRILQVDTFATPTAWANTQGLAGAYRRAGELYAYDYRAKVHEVRAPWSRPEIWHKPKWKELVEQGLSGMREDIVKVATWFKPDLVHLGKCEYLDGETMRRIKENTGAFVVHFYGDHSREPKPWVVNIGQVADWTLLCHQDSYTVAAHEEQGCQQVGFWWPGTDPTVFYPRGVEERDFDILFMGGPIRGVGHERAELLGTLAKLGLEVHIFGGNWKRLAGLEHIHPHGFTDGDGFAWACSRAKIALSLNTTARMYTSWRRVFNTMASGTFLLIRYFPGLETVFVEGKHLAWFTSKEEAIQKARYYLAHDAERDRIARQGMELVWRKHTWDVRAAEILGLMKEAERETN